MMVEIERNVVGGHYAYRNIAFDPYDEGAGTYRRKRSRFFCYLPDAMYQVVAMSEPPDRAVSPMPEGLPVGLAALDGVSGSAARDAAPASADEARGRALVALAKFEDSIQPVVELEGDRVVAIHLEYGCGASRTSL